MLEKSLRILIQRYNGERYHLDTSIDQNREVPAMQVTEMQQEPDDDDDDDDGGDGDCATCGNNGEWSIGTPIIISHDPISPEAIAREINRLYHQPIKNRRKTQTETEDSESVDGWDAPTPVTNSSGVILHPISINGWNNNGDDDDEEEDSDEETSQKQDDDPLRNIDWNTLTEEELLERMNKIEEQSSQRWLTIDINDPAYCKVLNAIEGLYVDSDTGEGGIVPVGEDNTGGEENPWL